MPASIGVNLRVTGHCRQGGRKYMEDFFSVAYQQTPDERDLEYAFFGIYDGHGGSEAASYAKEHLMELIVRQKNFWSENDDDVLKAIKEGYIATHYAMWREQVKWPKTASGLPSTAGTTASIAFIRRGKIYIGHVGDSGIVLGYQESESSNWLAKPLTRDHKPENEKEFQRIEQCGGKVVAKSGVPRVVWNRPKIGHQGPIRRSTPIDEIPFLAVARSLGDLWSYNSQLDEFVVSPDPDCLVIPIDTNSFRCLIFGTDGLYNMLNPQMAVHIVQQAEKHNEIAALSDDCNKVWTNPSKCLVEKALERWSITKMRADNTSVITLLLDPPGPPRAQVLQNRKRKEYPDSGLEIVTRYEQGKPSVSKRSCVPNEAEEKSKSPSPLAFCSKNLYNEKVPENNKQKTSCDVTTNIDEASDTFVPKTRESLSYDPHNLSDSDSSLNKSDENVQINEISSSSNEEELPKQKNFLSKNKKVESTSHRPVLRNRNAKTAENKKSTTKKTDVKSKLNDSLTNENNADGQRQLRSRQVDSSSQTQKVSTPSTSVCKSRNWLSKSILENTPKTIAKPPKLQVAIKTRSGLRCDGLLNKKKNKILRRSKRQAHLNVSLKKKLSTKIANKSRLQANKLAKGERQKVLKKRPER